MTIGPAHIVRTWNDIVATRMLSMPAVVVAPYLDARQLATIDKQRVYGIALDRGSYIDPMWQELQGWNKASVMGAQGLMDAVKPGDLVAIDGEEGIVVVAPEGTILKYYQERKGTRCKRDPHWVNESMRRMVDAIRPARFARGWRPPLDLPPADNLQLLAIARKVAGGKLPSDDDDAFVQGLMTPPRVEPDELPELEFQA